MVLKNINVLNKLWSTYVCSSVTIITLATALIFPAYTTPCKISPPPFSWSPFSSETMHGQCNFSSRLWFSRSCLLLPAWLRARASTSVSATSKLLVVSIAVRGLPWFCIVNLFVVGNIYNDSCNVVDGHTTPGNPCTQGIFVCNPFLFYSTCIQIIPLDFVGLTTHITFSACSFCADMLVAVVMLFLFA